MKINNVIAVKTSGSTKLSSASESFLFSRRSFLTGLISLPLAMTFSVPSFAAVKKTAGTCLPVLLFHRVADVPRYREQMSPDGLQEFFTYLWEDNFVPVNFTDILKNRLTDFVPEGKKPVCITSDDSHPSMFFNRFTSSRIPCERSFMEVFLSTLQQYNLAPRASFFVNGIKCFGEIMPMSDILDKLEKDAPGIECGYHTMSHHRMDVMSVEQAKRSIVSQMEGFRQLGIEERISKIFAYPFGLKPRFDMQPIFEELGFYGAFHSFQVCPFNGELEVSPFLVPRQPVCPFAYQRNRSLPHRTISAVDQFKKEVMNDRFQPYVMPKPVEKNNES